MTRYLRNRHLVRICQLGIGFVFLFAALAKIGDLSTFAFQIHNFRLAPVWAENLVAMTLPWIELIAGLSLILAIRPRAGGMVSTVLMAVFLMAVGIAVARGLDIECGCFGTTDGTNVGLAKMAENSMMLIVAWISMQAPHEG